MFNRTKADKEKSNPYKNEIDSVKTKIINPTETTASRMPSFFVFLLTTFYLEILWTFLPGWKNCLKYDFKNVQLALALITKDFGNFFINYDSSNVVD